MFVEKEEFLFFREVVELHDNAQRAGGWDHSP